MQSVTLTRTIDAPPETLTAAMDDLEPFTLAAGFDEATADGDDIHVANRVGIAEIELVLELVDDPDAALAYEQREEIFETMTTSYEVDAAAGAAPDGNDGATASERTEVTARTEFAMDVAIVGGVLDATVSKRQRRTELAAQLDWLEEHCAESDF